MMKHYVILLCATLATMATYGQGSGLGYTLDMGGSAWSQAIYEYDQFIGSVTHNGFIRKHNEAGNRATQFVLGYKTDVVAFQNYSTFMEADNHTLSEFDTDARIRRNAWKFAVVEQFQFGKRPGKFMVSLNPGLFYERTIRAQRYSPYNNLTYSLQEEIREHNFGYTLGIEARLSWVTIGYKVEQLFNDVLDHGYILGQELHTGNSSELRGLMLHPVMSYFYVGINIDFFKKHKNEQ